MFLMTGTTPSAIGTISALRSFTLSLKVLNNVTIGPLDSIKGDTNKAPILANDDLRLDKAPLNVSFAFFAPSPKALYIASENISKDT